jgi:two-component system invasion response regulator UvrY
VYDKDDWLSIRGEIAGCGLEDCGLPGKCGRDRNGEKSMHLEVKRAVSASAAGVVERPPALGAGPLRPFVYTKFGWERIADMPAISILMACERHLVRAGLKLLLREEFRDLVFEEAKADYEALVHVTQRPWNLVVFDMEMAGRNGFQALHEVLLQRPGTRVLLIGAVANPPSLAGAKRMGALGYVATSASRAELLKAVRAVLSGKAYFRETSSAYRQNPKPQEPTKLSVRERDVLLAVAAGKRVNEIAAELNLSSKTVSTYKRRGLIKMHLKSVPDLVRYVVDNPIP